MDCHQTSSFAGRVHQRRNITVEQDKEIAPGNLKEKYCMNNGGGMLHVAYRGVEK